MLEPVERHRRDSTLFQFTTKRLQDFINPGHILLKIDAEFDFSNLIKPLEEKYCPDNGRPAIHPEVLVRALLLLAIYNIASFRQLCHSISENIAFRWFLFMTIDDEVFDHSTITYFIERIGREGFKSLFISFNRELLRLGLLSSQVYADSTLVKANVSSTGLQPTPLSVDEFAEKAEQENDLFVVRQVKEEPGEPPKVEEKYYQDPQGRLPLSSVDRDARWRIPRKGERAILGYKENAIIDRGGFILARGVSRANKSDVSKGRQLLDELPLPPSSFSADTNYGDGSFRAELKRRGIQGFIPLHPKQVCGSLASGGFKYRDGKVVCPEGKMLKPAGEGRRDEVVAFVAKQADCQACSRKESCLPAKAKRKYMTISRYHPLFQEAKAVMETKRHQEEMRWRRIIVEGVFARLDRLAWREARLRGLWKVDCQGYIAALGHNILKAVKKLEALREAAALARLQTQGVAELCQRVLSNYFPWLKWLASKLAITKVGAQ